MTPYLPEEAIAALAETADLVGAQLGTAWGERRIADEDDFTSRLVDRCEERISALQVSGVTWRAEKFRSHGPGADEKLVGADLLISLSIVHPRIRLAKGFLVQAKIRGPGRP